LQPGERKRRISKEQGARSAGRGFMGAGKGREEKEEEVYPRMPLIATKGEKKDQPRKNTKEHKKS
jgi:hypothetical protein